MSTALAFTVPGQGVPQGSKNAYRRGDRIVLVESSSRLPAWRSQVVEQASRAIEHSVGEFPIDGPVQVWVTFSLKHPKRNGTPWPTKRPDVDKLARAVLDALTIAGVFGDDSQVVHLTARKVWALGDPQTDVEVRAL